jgi:DNA repair exonuclease SbcCD ATPase subunit
MQIEKKKSKEDLKEIILNDDSNIILPEISFPSTYQAQPVKLGAKSTEQQRASERELLEYQKRVTRRDSIPTNEEIRNLVSETNERRRALEQSIVEQKEEFQQKRADELEARRTKQREEERAHRIANENDTQRQMRIAAEEEVKTNHTKEIQGLVNKCRREKEEIEAFFLQSSNRFTQKYCNPITQKKISEETGIDRIISSRHFSGTYSNRYAHRCVPCGYHFPESLSISKIYQHIFENKDKHMQYALDTIDNTYNVLITDTRKKHVAEDNHDLRQQKLSKDLEALKRLKGAKYR